MAQKHEPRRPGAGTRQSVQDDLAELLQADGPGSDERILVRLLHAAKTLANRAMGPHVKRWVEADDVAQQAVIEELPFLGDKRQRSARATLRRLARRIEWRVADQARRHKDDKGWSAAGAQPDPGATSLSRKLDRREFLAGVGKRIDRVGEPDSSILRKVILEDKTYGQIGQEMGGFSADAVRKRYERAVQSLQREAGFGTQGGLSAQD